MYICNALQISALAIAHVFHCVSVCIECTLLHKCMLLCIENSEQNNQYRRKYLQSNDIIQVPFFSFLTFIFKVIL